MKFRFRVLPAVALAAFAVALTAVTITVAMAKFESLAEANARAVFTRIAQRNADGLQSVLTNVVATVGAQASLVPERLFKDGSPHTLDRANLVPALVATLRAYPHLYSAYYGLSDGAFLQVIGVRGKDGLVDTVHVPDGTAFAVRYIEPAVAGQPRRELWRFIASNGKLLGDTERDASYDPRSRLWYGSAHDAAGLHVTAPYIYESQRSLGVTLSQALADGGGVFGADVSLGDLRRVAADTLDKQDGGVVITDDRGRVLAAHASGNLDKAPRELQTLSASSSPLFAHAAAMLGQDGSGIHSVSGDDFVYASRSVTVAPGTAYNVVAFAPMSLYTGSIDRARDGIVLSAGLLLLLFLPLAQVVAKRISGALERLTADAERIQRLDFSGVGTVRSVFKEIDLLGVAQQTMKTALRERTAALDEVLARQESLLESGTQLSSRRSRDMVVRQTLDSARRLVEAQSGQFWLRGEDGELRLAAWFRDDVADAVAPDLVLAPDTAAADPCMRAAMEKKTVMPGAAPHDFDLGTQRLLLGAEPSSLLAVPVLARGASVMGVLVLTGARDHGAAAPFDPAMARYAETLAAQSGVALENMALLASQRMLMDSLIQLVASAIDAKSEYTAGHCLRVPELARLLAEAACEVTEGPLAAFRFETDDEWREFRVGTWLHDCGKVTTPEYVVDKATKLETLFNRIHEIRTRFEVLLRDAEIDRLKAVLGGTDAAAAQAIFEARRAVLREDFAFVANCNVGGEHMPQEYVERLRGIGATTWLRHFDDRLGLSHIEEERLAGQPPAPLPATERLLADKPEHIVPRTEHDRYDDRYGFRMKVPEHLYNFGELYNLSIQRGTLTAEERYKVNEHIVQTIVMLDQLPLPPDLQRVPEYAGTHHESLAGDGYPRGLKGGELSIPARIMAIADIFEALTASDRPYKKAKPLSEAVRILETFRARGHIDDDLFKLFLTSGVYLDYARRYLPPEQIDRVDIGAYVGG